MAEHVPSSSPPTFASLAINPPGINNGGDAPPTYSVSHPQILVAPLPDSASFFWGRTVQGEIFVKGLGENEGSPRVRSLTVQLHLDDELPNQPTISLVDFPLQTIYPPTASSSSAADKFRAVNRFNFSLPSFSTLPGTLNLTASSRGQVCWWLEVFLTLPNGEVVSETVPVEGTPQEFDPASEIPDQPSAPEQQEEVEEVLERDGVKCRLLLGSVAPRLGSLFRLGVEVRPMERKKTGVAGLSSQPDPSDTLRPLRRVRVELFRRVTLTPSSSQAASSSTAPHNDGDHQHWTLLYTSGKSLRYPGSSSSHPPLRVLFNVPTTQAGNVADQIWGETTQSTPYHTTQFFVRATLGFGGADASPTSDKPWLVEREIEIRPKVWTEPKEIVIQDGLVPALGEGEGDGLVNEEEARKAAYRLKGRDIVGEGGTYRSGMVGGLPPPFHGAGPSGPSGANRFDDQGGSGDLPTFTESQQQMRTGAVPLPVETVRSERLVPIRHAGDDGPVTEVLQRTSMESTRSSIGGELGSWVEYDGYETFSVAPPSVAASFGAAGVMDPPQEGDEDVNVVPGVMGRLGLEAGPSGTTGELIESLGLGAGSRVVDLQDDLPPGIDEPSLPALPDFHHSRPSHHTPPHHHPRGHPHETPSVEQPPPSFAASEAAAAVAGRRASHSRHHAPVVAPGHGDAPPGYLVSGVPAPAPAGGPPAYS